MRVPAALTLPEIQAAFRDLYALLDPLVGGNNIDLKGRRIINAGDSVNPQDYATRTELTPRGTAATPLVVDVETVNKVLTVLGILRFRSVALVSPSTGVLRVVKGDGTTLAEIQGSDVVLNAHAMLAATLANIVDVKTASGAAYATIKALKFQLSSPATYTPTNVTPRRSGDFSALTTDQVRDLVGTLITDLQAGGLLA